MFICKKKQFFYVNDMSIYNLYETCTLFVLSYKIFQMAEGKLPKPQLRDLHLTRVRRTLGIAALLCTFTGMSWKILVTDRFERKAEEFYK